MKLRGYDAIGDHLRTHGVAFDLDRHQLYRLSQRAEHPLPIDGPVGMPISTREALDAWVDGERKRRNVVASSSQLALFG